MRQTFKEEEIVCINWHVLRTIWRITYNEPEKTKIKSFSSLPQGKGINFFNLFGIKGTIAREIMIYKKQDGKHMVNENFDYKTIQALSNKTNIPKDIFQGKRLILPINNNSELGNALRVFVTERMKQNTYSTPFIQSSKEIVDHLMKCKSQFKDGELSNVDMSRAFYFIQNGIISDEKQEHVKKLTETLNSVSYNDLYNIEKKNLYEFLRALKKQEKLVTAMIIYKQNNQN